MTDKERIEVYVNELPKSCKECRYISTDVDDGNCYHCFMPDNDDPLMYPAEICKRNSSCPLKTIQSMQNQKAVDALQKVRKIFLDATLFGDIVITDDIKYFEQQIDQLIKEYGGKE